MSEKRNLQQQEESESARLESLYRKASDAVLRTHLLMVWRISRGDSVEEVAQMVGYSSEWVREIKTRYEAGGVDALGDRRHGNPGAKERALLDETGEEGLLEALSGSPELQPTERLWPLTNEALANRLFEEIEQIEQTLMNRCVELLDQSELIKDLTNYHWLPQAA
jgi:transposase